MVGDLVGPETADQRQSAGLVGWIEDVDQVQQTVGGQRRSAFQADGVLDAAEELDMRTVRLSGPVADPDHMARGGVMIAAGRIDARHRLLVAEQKRFVRGVELRLPKLGVMFGVEADRLHEAERLRQAIRDLAVARRLRTVLDEAQHPAVGVFEIGVSAAREGAQQVQGRCRLAVGVELTLGVGCARCRIEIDAVDDVAPVTRKLETVHCLGRSRARLGELPGDPADLHDRHGTREGEHQRHLQEDAERITDVVGRVFGESLGAIAALQQKGPAPRDVAEVTLQLARLTCENERGEPRDLRLDGRQCRGIRVLRHLFDGLRPPGRR